jgi:acetyltransferase-like isoleucine patch superfamily enzyme
VRQLLAKLVQRLRYYHCRLRGYDVHITCELERRLNLDRYHPRGIHVGRHTILASGVTVLSHKLIPLKSQGRYVGEKLDTHIGEFCVIGVGAIVMGGVRIGDEVVVGAGAVVTHDVPSNSMVAGNPARIIARDIRMEGLRL